MAQLWVGANPHDANAKGAGGPRLDNGHSRRWLGDTVPDELLYDNHRPHTLGRDDMGTAFAYSGGGARSWYSILATQIAVCQTVAVVPTGLSGGGWSSLPSRYYMAGPTISQMSPNKRPAVDAWIPLLLAAGRHWPGTTEPER